MPSICGVFARLNPSNYTKNSQLYIQQTTSLHHKNLLMLMGLVFWSSVSFSLCLFNYGFIPPRNATNFVQVSSLVNLKMDVLPSNSTPCQLVGHASDYYQVQKYIFAECTLDFSTQTITCIFSYLSCFLCYNWSTNYQCDWFGKYFVKDLSRKVITPKTHIKHLIYLKMAKICYYSANCIHDNIF